MGRAIADKCPSRPASSARRLVIGATFTVLRVAARAPGAWPFGGCGTRAPVDGGWGPHAPRAGRGRLGVVAHMPRYAGVVAHAPQCEIRDPARKRQPAG